MTCRGQSLHFASMAKSIVFTTYYRVWQISSLTCDDQISVQKFASKFQAID